MWAAVATESGLEIIMMGLPGNMTRILVTDVEMYHNIVFNQWTREVLIYV